MSTITFDYGGANLSYECQKGGHAEPRRAGSKQTSFAQRLTSSVRREFMVVPLVLQPVTPSQAAVIRALFANGAQVPCRGSVFNNSNATIVCSATISDELDQTAAWWTLNITLYECASVGYTPLTVEFVLTSVDSPDSADPDTYVLATGGNFGYPGDSSTSFTLLPSATPDDVCTGGTCLTSVAPADERSWLLPAVTVPGVISGSPVVRFETAMSGAYSGTTVWALMSAMFNLYHVRGGVDIAGPFATGWGGVGFGGGEDFVTTLTAVLLDLQVGDRLRLGIRGRLALQPGHTDNAQRQVVAQGSIAGPRRPPVLIVRSTAPIS